jgi:hypothetical protein
MEKYKKIIFAALAIAMMVVVVWGCNKGFLDKKPIGQYTIETYFTDEAKAFQAVVGVYDVSGWDKTFDRMFWTLGDGASDDSNFGMNRDDGSPPYVDINPITDYANVAEAKFSPAFENMYKGFYEGINRANIAINGIETAPVSDQKRARFIAECKALRAIYYFMLVNYYGGVPLFTKPINPGNAEDVNLPRATARQVYDQIEKDLTEAIPALPTKQTTIDEKMVGRVTKGAAGALLAKVFLFDKKYTEAAAAAQVVIASGEYDLNPSYYANFVQATANGIESVWEIQRVENFTDNGGGWGPDSFDGTLTPIRVGCGNGMWGQNAPSGDLYNQFQPGDGRRKYTATTTDDVIQGVTMCGNAGAPGMGKHVVPGKEISDYKRYDIIPLNWPLFRFSDVLLTRSEALMSEGSIGAAAKDEAIDLLIKVRNRAGLTLPSKADYQSYTNDELLRNIRNERRLELGMEAWRLFDLRRWGVDSLKNALVRVGKINTTTRPWEDRYMLYPIPQSEIELSKGIVKQTPGY